MNMLNLRRRALLLLVLTGLCAAQTPLPLAVMRYTNSGLDLKTAAATVLCTTRSTPPRFHPMEVIFEVTSADTVTTVPTCALGTSPTYSDVLAATPLTGLTASNTLLRVPIVTAVSSPLTATDLYVNVTVGATATTCTGKVILLGYYE